MKLFKSVYSALIAGALLVTLAGCEQKGPAERAGEKVDNAIEKVGEKIEATGDQIQDTAQGDSK